MESFAQRFGLWSAEQEQEAASVEEQVAEAGLGVVRFAFVDAHGVLRGKTLVAAEAMRLLRDGATATTTLLLKDLSGKTAFPVFTPGGGFGMAELQGGRGYGHAAGPVDVQGACHGRRIAGGCCAICFSRMDGRCR